MFSVPAGFVEFDDVNDCALTHCVTSRCPSLRHQLRVDLCTCEHPAKILKAGLDMGGIVVLAATWGGTTFTKVELKVLLHMWGRRYNVYDLRNYHLIFSISDADVEGIQVRHPWQGLGWRLADTCIIQRDNTGQKVIHYSMCALSKDHPCTLSIWRPSVDEI